MGEERRQIRAAAIIACIAHVMAAVAVWRAGAGSTSKAAALERDTEISIEVPDEDRAERETQSSPSRAPTTSANAMTMGGQRAGALSASTAFGSRETSTGAVSSSNAPEASSAPAPSEPAPRIDDGWTFNPSRVDVYAGGNARLAGSLAANENAGRQNGGAHALADAVDSADAARGLGRGGAVLTIVEDVTRTSLTPEEGSATFSIIVWKNGDVRAALVSASSGDESWRRVLGDIEEGVKKKNVPVPENASAVRVDVRVESTIRWADGRRPANAGTTPVVQGLGHTGSVMDDTQMVGVRHENKYCVGKFGLTPAGLQALGACSPENGAQPASRQVRAQVTGVSRID
jgi:hypothetical protein